MLSFSHSLTPIVGEGVWDDGDSRLACSVSSCERDETNHCGLILPFGEMIECFFASMSSARATMSMSARPAVIIATSPRSLVSSSSVRATWVERRRARRVIDDWSITASAVSSKRIETTSSCLSLTFVDLISVVKNERFAVGLDDSNCFLISVCNVSI